MTERNLKLKPGFARLLSAAAIAALTATLGLQAAHADTQNEVTIALGSEENTLDANLVFGKDTKNVVISMFDLPFIQDHQGNLQPGIIQTWEMVNPTTWEFTMREDVTFHNGEPLNAESFVYTINRVRNPETKSAQAVRVRSIADAKVLSDYKFQIITDGIDVILPLRLQFVPIVPPKYIAEVGEAEFGSNPVGSGPYKFVEWSQGNHIKLEANEDYWQGSPEIKGATFRIIPESSTALAALQTGEVDVVKNVPADLLDHYNSLDGVKVNSIRGARTIYIALDSSVKPLDDVRVRKALNHAVNVDEIVQYVFNGKAERVPTLLGDMYYGSDDPTLKPYEHDLEKAKALLAEAGYPDGITIPSFCPTGRYARDKEVCQAVVGQLAKAGVTLDAQVLEWGNMIARYRAHDLSPSHLLGFATPLWDSGDGFSDVLACGSKGSYYCDPELDAIVEEARGALDPDTRKELYYKANHLIKETAPLIFLYLQYDNYGTDSKLDWTPRANEEIRIFEMSWSD